MKPFKQGDLVYTHGYRVLRKDFDWTMADVENLQEMAFNQSYATGEDIVIPYVSPRTPCLVGDQRLVKDEWMIFLITPKGNGWLPILDLKNNDRST